MSPTLVKIKDDMKSAGKEIQNSARLSAKAINDMKRGFESAGDRAVKLVASATGAAATLAATVGFGEATALEGYRAQLETATKDTERAAEVMRYSIGLANKTPFEGSEMVAAASALESFGLKSERWLTVLGDSAAGVNRSMDEVRQGFIKAVTTGKFESLEDTLSVTKDMVSEYSRLHFGRDFANASGTITDINLMQDALEGLLSERFGGGMERLSNTTKGLWSTITGVSKNSLAQIIGMTVDGEVRVGSVLYKLKEKAKTVADTLVRWQEDGTIERIASDFTSAFDRISETAERVFKIIGDNKELIKLGAGLLAVAYGAIKITSGILKIKKAVDTFRGIKKGFDALTLSTSGWLLAILAIVGAVWLIYENWEEVSAYLTEKIEQAKRGFQSLKDGVLGTVESIGETVIKWLQPIIDMIDKITEKLDWFKSVQANVPKVNPQSFDFAVPQINIPQYATGTGYARGGLSRINERGGEIVNLPSGAQVIPADKSRTAGMIQVKVNVIIQGNVVGNAQFAEMVGNIVGRRVLAAIANV